ncbi:MAG: ABC transporter permease, partial [Bryobacteraceae bacterium]
MHDWRRFVREHLPRLGLSPEREQEIAEELRQQLEQSYAEARDLGASEPDAVRAACMQIRDWSELAAEIRRAEQPLAAKAAAQAARHLPDTLRTALQEKNLRSRRGGNMFADFLQDIRYAFRMLRKSPGFAVIVALTLALGIGANAAIFSIVNSVLLRPLPYANSGRVMALYESSVANGMPQMTFSPGNFQDYRAQNRSFERMGASAGAFFTFAKNGTPERVNGFGVTSDFFAVFGVQPELGRLFQADDYLAGKNPVAVLSHGFWQSNLGGDRGVIGRAVVLDGQSCTIIGVLPAGFQLPDQPADVWTPLTFTPTLLSHRGAHFLTVNGLLRKGVTVSQANADLASIGAGLSRLYSKTNENWSAYAVSLHDDVVSASRTALLVLFGAVAFVLLIACANAANMLLSRAASRRREMSIRAALGAGRLRIVRQLLTESMLLACAGGIAGLLIAVWAVRLARALPASYLPLAASIHMDANVLLFAFAATLL